MKLPRDIEILQAHEDSPFDALGYRWLKAGYVPYGYDGEAGVPEDVAAAWQQMFQQLTFIAETDEGAAVAIWKFRDDVPLETAPLVELDTEGQLKVTARTLTDQLLQGLPAEQFSEVRDQLAQLGLESSSTATAIQTSRRFLPDPQMRFETILNGKPAASPARNVDPKELLDLLGMHGEDPRVAAYLAAVENPEQPIELRCDGEGLLRTIFLSPDSLKTKVPVKGVSLGDPVASLAALSTPERETPYWRRWINNGQAIHVEVKEDRIVRMTVWVVS